MKKRTLDTIADIEAAWLEEALDGIGALKRAWGKPSVLWSDPVLRPQVNVRFKTGSCLIMYAPTELAKDVFRWRRLVMDLRDTMRRRDWFDVVKGEKHASR